MGKNYPPRDVASVADLPGDPDLTWGAVAEGQLVRRSGTSLLGVSPAGVDTTAEHNKGGALTVAVSGGDYTTSTAALAVAAANSVVLVYPGTYAGLRERCLECLRGYPYWGWNAGRWRHCPGGHSRRDHYRHRDHTGQAVPVRLHLPYSRPNPRERPCSGLEAGRGVRRRCLHDVHHSKRPSLEVAVARGNKEAGQHLAPA